ncbi:MAG: hypothetical protein Q7S08_05050 [bacterium]|nr:hypothetical protein [bacterium]
MKSFLRNHLYALILAIVVGAVCVAPSLLATAALGSGYRGIQYGPLNNEETYRTRIQEILDGHPMVTSPYFYEYKDSPVVIVPVNEWLYAIPAFIFGLAAVMVASKFLLPAILFLLVYFLVRKLLGNQGDALSVSTALAAAFFVTLGSAFVDYRSMFTLLSHGGTPGPHMWTRPVHPITGAVQLFGFLLLLLSVWERKWRYAYVAAGVLLATTIGYFFTLGLSFAILGALCLLAFLRKEFAVAREMIYVLLISIAIDAWYWYHMFASFGSSSGSALAQLNGLFFTHAPVLNKALLAATLIVLCLFAYSYLWKKSREHIRNWVFIAGLLLGSWLAFNQQVLTGREIWYQHFVQYTVPLAGISVIMAAYLAFRTYTPRALYAGMITLSLICLAYGFGSIRSFTFDLPSFAHDQKFGSVMTWLNLNAPKDCVVLVAYNDEWFERLIPAFTSCNVYTTIMRYAADVPESRIVHNFLLRMRLNGVRARDAHAYLVAHEDDVRNYFYTDWNQAFGHGEEPWILDRIALLEKEYQVFLKKSLEQNIKTYRVDYIVSDKPLTLSLRNALPDLELATSTEAFYIYEFR